MDAPIVLIIEDESSFRSLLRFKIHRLGYTVLEATDALEGISLAKKHLPALVVCDFKMPHSPLNGYEVWEALQQDADLRTTPFIIHSGQVDDRWRQHWHPLLRKLDPISRQAGSNIRLVEKNGKSPNRVCAVIGEFLGAPPSGIEFGDGEKGAGMTD